MGRPGVTALGLALVLAGQMAVASGCVRIQRTDPTHPTTFEGIDAMCRREARNYRQAAASYARCMREHGYPNRGADDY